MSHRIVVLDGYALNPGDLNWDALAALGETTIHDRTAAAQTLARSEGAPILLTNKTVLDAAALAALPALRYVGVLATGYNVIDTAAAKARGVVVTNVPAYGTDSVAQMVFAHLLNLTQRVAEHAAGVRGGRWTASKDFCYWDWPLVELAGLTLGLVGLGRIGRRTAEIARAFGMNVIACDPAAVDWPAGVERVALDDVFARADAVSLHCPLTDATKGLVNRHRLSRMKKTALLINTSRGPLVDQEALAEALASGRIAGAGVDVLDVEPPPAANPLLGAPNCYITPHIAWATRSARQRLLGIAIDNVRAFLAGKPINVVNA